MAITFLMVVYVDQLGILKSHFGKSTLTWSTLKLSFILSVSLKSMRLSGLARFVTITSATRNMCEHVTSLTSQDVRLRDFLQQTVVNFGSNSYPYAISGSQGCTFWKEGYYA